MQSAGDFSTIPLVDISSLIAGDAQGSRAAAAALGKAARQVGFVYVTGHGIPQPLFDGLLDAAVRFFAQPIAKKMVVYIGQSANHRGYVPAGEEVFAAGTKDAKEAFDLSIDLPSDDPAVSETPMLGPNQWPDLPDFKSQVAAYYDAVFAVGRALIRGFAMALGEAPDFFDPYITKPPSQLRLIHYPFNRNATDAIGIGAHSDYECFTLLYSTSPGLEVMNGSGQWIDAPPVPGALTINIGDLLELWTTANSPPPPTACAGCKRSVTRSRCSSWSITGRRSPRSTASRGARDPSAGAWSPASISSPRRPRALATWSSG